MSFFEKPDYMYHISILVYNNTYAKN